ncbi:hypothetical protein LCGC14_0370710 [marine sediment metagenome]|uniref:Uncharacterized protein n=1 Tax=marine sediment metagenome TaxID=412755 RepID=A0A0F9T5A6_9ZZZZ|nr:hypothetical protein [Maribacter sp.]HDZ04834.1 hypothetical protein [Maribacter sp.]
MTIGRNRNTSPTATVSGGITLNSSSSTTIAVANTNRVFLHVSNNDNAIGFWLKLQPASVDDDMKGIFISSKVGAIPFWEMPTDNIYTGELCAITEAGTFEIFITEY